MNDLSEAVERLTRSVADLQSRVSALENPARTLPPLPAQPVLSAPAVYATAAEAPSFAGGAGIFPVLGKAMLGIAGAYLLRAVVQSAALPRAPVVAVAIAYAVLWLVPAARAPAKAWFASAAWAGSSALILIPMLWELTLRFRILPSAVTAGILSIWAIAASALVWKRHFAAVGGTVYTAASLAALVLAVATRDPAPFLFALLAIAFIGEAAAAGHRALRVRPVIAAAADLAVFALIWIYSSPAASHADYPAIAAPVLLAFAPALLLIYAASAAAQTLLLRRGISFFEIAQTLMAALLTVWTVLEFWPGHGPLVLGVLCLIASAAGYAVTFAWFDRLHAQRNYHVYATGSLALLLAGSFLCLPRGWLPLCLGLFCRWSRPLRSAHRARHAPVPRPRSSGSGCLFLRTVRVYRSRDGGRLSCCAGLDRLPRLRLSCSLLCRRGAARFAALWTQRAVAQVSPLCPRGTGGGGDYGASGLDRDLDSGPVQGRGGRSACRTDRRHPHPRRLRRRARPRLARFRLATPGTGLACLGYPGRHRPQTALRGSAPRTPGIHSGVHISIRRDAAPRPPPSACQEQSRQRQPQLALFSKATARGSSGDRAGVRRR
jgi:hypothetical protein